MKYWVPVVAWVVAACGLPQDAPSPLPDFPEPGAPRQLGLSIWGSTGSGPYNVFQLMDNPLAQTVCLTVNREAKSLADIAREIQADEAEVGKLVDVLVREGVLCRTDEGLYRADFIALEADHKAELDELEREAGSALAEAIAPQLERLRRAYEETPLAREGWSWEHEMVYLVGGGLLCSQGLRRNSRLEVPLGPERASGGRYWLLGSEIVEGGGPSRGSQFNTMGHDALPYALFAITPPWRQTPYPSERARDALALIAHGRAPDEPALQVKLGCTPEEAQEALQELADAGLVRRDEGRLALTFPVFRDEDSRLLTPVIDDMADQACREVLLPRLSEVEGRLEDWGYDHLREQLPAYIGKVRSSCMVECLHCLLDAGVFPPIPDPPPAGFGFLGWEWGIPLLD